MTNINTQKNWEDRTKSIPKELKELNQWVCHRDKLPINAKTGKVASVSDRLTWSSYKEACKFADAHSGYGIGYVITKESGIVGIDLDKCLVYNENSHKVQLINHELIRRVAETKSYKEYSPSGTGLHMYVKGKWNGNANKVILDKATKLAVEVYDNARFFTVTGDKYYSSDELSDELSKFFGFDVNEPDIIEDQELLDYIADYLAQYKATTATVKRNSNTVSIESMDVTDDEKEQLNAALEENSYFNNLWNGGRPKGNESSDDMSLLYHLAQIYGDDAETIKKLFLASPHTLGKDVKHLKKIERKDYLDNSIAKAIELACSHDKEPDTLHLLQYPNNDTGNADRFLALFNSQVRCNIDTDQWYRYDGTYWQPQTLARMKYCCDELTSTMEELSEWTCDPLHHKIIANIGNEATMNNMLRNAARKVAIEMSDLNKESNLIVANNGIVDLTTGELLPHDSSYLITRKVNINYNLEAPEPTRFLQFLDEICCCDNKLMDYLMLSLGYAITGETKEQIMFIWNGDGSNGKGVLMNLLRKMFKDFCGSLSQDSLLKKKEATSINPTVAEALTKRIAFLSEFNRNAQLDTALVKSLTGQDDVQVRELYKNHVTMNPNCKIIAATNFLPQIDWTDYAMRRRVVIIPFNAIFAGKNCDPNLESKLLEEQEGIFKLLVDQAKRYYQEGLLKDKTILREPEFMKRYLNEELRKSDRVHCFIEDKLDITENNEDIISQEELYRHYRGYCIENGYDAENQTNFGKKFIRNCDVERRNYTVKRTVHYFGVKLKEEATLEDDVVA